MHLELEIEEKQMRHKAIAALNRAKQKERSLQHKIQTERLDSRTIVSGTSRQLKYVIQELKKWEQ